MDDDPLWQAVAMTTGIATVMVVRKVVAAGWSSATGRAAPKGPGAPGTGWPEALGYAAVSGAVLGVSRMLVQRGAAEAWRAAAGRYPAPIEKARA